MGKNKHNPVTLHWAVSFCATPQSADIFSPKKWYYSTSRCMISMTYIHWMECTTGICDYVIAVLKRKPLIRAWHSVPKSGANACFATNQGCQIFLCLIYQNGEKYTKLPLNYLMVIKYTKWNTYCIGLLLILTYCKNFTIKFYIQLNVAL
jgi:hypothetical protein